MLDEKQIDFLRGFSVTDNNKRTQQRDKQKAKEQNGPNGGIWTGGMHCGVSGFSCARGVFVEVRDVSGEDGARL